MMGIQITKIETEEQALSYKSYAESLQELMKMNNTFIDEFRKLIDRINIELHIWENR